MLCLSESRHKATSIILVEMLMAWTRWQSQGKAPSLRGMRSGHSQYILKAELTELTGGLDVGCEWKADPKTMTQANEMKELPFNEEGRETEGQEARQQIRSLLLNMPSLI